jgi:hypothetical protein
LEVSRLKFTSRTPAQQIQDFGFDSSTLRMASTACCAAWPRLTNSATVTVDEHRNISALRRNADSIKSKASLSPRRLDVAIKGGFKHGDRNRRVVDAVRVLFDPLAETFPQSLDFGVQAFADDRDMSRMLGFGDFHAGDSATKLRNRKA